MKHILFKIQKGKEGAWKEWCSYLCKHHLEAKETMREENSVYERSIMYERNGDYFVVGTSQFSDVPKKANLNVELNIKHQKAKEEFLGRAIAVFEGEFKLPPVYETLYSFDLREK